MHDFRTYTKIVLEQERPLRFLISRLLKWTGVWRFIKVKKDGYSLLLQPSSISLALWVDSTVRNEDVAVIKMILRPGDCFYDIGANIGQLSIEAALLVGRSGNVTAFEAHPRTAQFFRNNVELNGLKNIKIVQSAVGEKCGWLAFTDDNADDQNRALEIGSIQVPVLTLDTLSGGEKINLLKVDIEGYELFAFKGALETLKNVDFVYFEAWDIHFAKYGYDFSNIYELLEAMGYLIGKINVTHETISILKKADAIPDCVNLLAWRDSDHLASLTGLKIV